MLCIFHSMHYQFCITVYIRDVFYIFSKASRTRYRIFAPGVLFMNVINLVRFIGTVFFCFCDSIAFCDSSLSVYKFRAVGPEFRQTWFRICWKE
jgi:hypothetical protein